MIKEKLKAILKNKITIAILAIMFPFLMEILMFRKIEINKVEELCGHALDGTWIASCTGEFQSGNNTFLYNIDGVDDNYVMFNINVLDENKPIVSGVGMYGTIQELFYGFCRGIAKIEYDESIK